MKIEYSDKIILYLNNDYIKYKKYDILKIENNLKEIFSILKEYYSIKLNGFYYVDIYIDKLYGIIIEIKQDDVDFDYYDSQIDMKIIFHKNKFLYQIEEIDNTKKIYLYKNKYYIENYEIEKSIPIYKTDEIFKYAKTIEILK